MYTAIEHRHCQETLAFTCWERITERKNPNPNELPWLGERDCQFHQNQKHIFVALQQGKPDILYYLLTPGDRQQIQELLRRELTTHYLQKNLASE